MSSSANTDNLTAVLYGIDDIRLEQRPIPEILPHQVLLRMEVVGICGSDVHYLRRGRIGEFIVEKPMVIGHEASGTVVKCGCKVGNLKPGDRVAIEPGEGCRICDFCKEGKYNLCPEMKFCATPPVDGNLTRFYPHAADFCYKLPDHVSNEEGALLEPLSVGVHACKRANLQFGETCVIFGAGTIGLVTLLTCKAFGAKQVLITDVVEHRLALAKKLGADHTLQVNPNDSDDCMTKKITDLLGGQANKSFDACGAGNSIRVAIKVTKAGGCVLIIGMGESEVTLPLTNALVREVDIRGIFRYCNDYPTALELVASGKVNVKPLVTHHFTMEETEKAFEAAQDPKEKPIKVLIHANPCWKK